jgi:hypothetical protein
MVFPFVKGLRQWMNAYNNNKQQQTLLTPSTSNPVSITSDQKNQIKKSPQLSKEEQRKLKQVQYFNKQIKEEYEDLVNIKDNKKYQKLTTSTSNTFSSSSSLTSNSQNINTHLNSRFKPVKQTKQQVHQVHASNTPGVLNIVTSSTTLTTNIIRSKSNFISKSADHHTSRATTANSQQTQSINQKVKKQLDFYGPECWINFKFDHEILFNELPSIIV